jgi:hypothetical protein
VHSAGSVPWVPRPAWTSGYLGHVPYKMPVETVETESHVDRHWRCSSVTECLLSRHKALGLSPAPPNLKPNQTN